MEGPKQTRTPTNIHPRIGHISFPSQKTWPCSGPDGTVFASKKADGNPGSHRQPKYLPATWPNADLATAPTATMPELDLAPPQT